MDAGWGGCWVGCILGGVEFKRVESCGWILGGWGGLGGVWVEWSLGGVESV